MSSENRRARRWHECLTVLKMQDEEADPTPVGTGTFKQGNFAHDQISAKFPDFTKNQEARFVDDGLPFDIFYHADLYDRWNRVVYEIKPRDWFLKNFHRCIAQVSGYRHFLDAKAAVFLLYRAFYTKDSQLITDYWPFNPPYLMQWEPELRSIAQASDRILLEGKA